MRTKQYFRNFNDRLMYFAKWRKNYQKMESVRTFERDLKVKYSYEKLYNVWQALKNHAIRSLSKSVRYETAV